MRRFFDGRNGTDELNRFLSIVTMVFLLLSMFTGLTILYSIAVVLLIFTLFRSFSRNLDKRQAENDWYLDRKDQIAGFFSGTKRRMNDRTHRYYKCPNCRKSLRVPKGKGKISIHCPQCGRDFIRRT